MQTKQIMDEFGDLVKSIEQMQRDIEEAEAQKAQI
jgi:hypothetical protein